MIRIAVDAMGGDHAPKVVVEGTLVALEQFDDLQVALVGPESLVEEHLAATDSRNHDRLEVVDAPEVIEMHESPVEALRKKRHSTIRIATGLVKRGEYDGLVSAGNTGAIVAASTMLLGLLPNVRRAGIAVIL